MPKMDKSKSAAPKLRNKEQDSLQVSKQHSILHRMKKSFSVAEKKQSVGSKENIMLYFE